MNTYQVNQEGYYGEFGGAYVPEILHGCITELQNAYRQVLDDPSFKEEFALLLRDYVGRPSPSTSHAGFQNATAAKSTSNGKTSTTPEHTR